MCSLEVFEFLPSHSSILLDNGSILSRECLDHSRSACSSMSELRSPLFLPFESRSQLLSPPRPLLYSNVRRTFSTLFSKPKVNWLLHDHTSFKRRCKGTAFPRHTQYFVPQLAPNVPQLVPFVSHLVTWSRKDIQSHLISSL